MFHSLDFQVTITHSKKSAAMFSGICDSAQKMRHKFIPPKNGLKKKANYHRPQNVVKRARCNGSKW